jgi:PAS domain S-box-containing protein
MECAPEAILVIDPDDGFAFRDVNEKACQLYGGSREQLLQFHAVRLVSAGPIRAASTLALLTEHVAQALRGIPATFEWTVYRLDGEPVLCEARLVRLPAGTRWLLRASLTDIGDRKRLEEERAKIENRMLQMQKTEAIGTLAGGIAHDFNNILACISGYTALAADKCVDDEQREDLAQVRAAAKRAAELTKQILAFSRQSRAVHEPTKVGLVVGEALRLLRATIPSTIEIHSHISSEAAVLADPAEIHRIVMNLCTNAALAMPEGGFLDVGVDDVLLDATLVSNGQSARSGSCVRLVVKDTGCGMTEEVKAHLFEPFFTTRERETGTGMGLAVVHGIVAGSRARSP